MPNEPIISHDEIQEYAHGYASALNDLQQEVLDYTLKKHSQHHMVSGAMQGKWLSMLSILLRPKRILEVGTFTGFSGLCLAEGLADDGLLYTLELREEDAETAQSYFDRSARASQIKLVRGSAAEIIPTLNETWDLVFIDADKTNYSLYFDQVFPSLAPNGVILADNVLFHGEVLQNNPAGKNAKAIAEFNNKIKSDPRVEHCLVPIRDGVMMITRKQTL